MARASKRGEQKKETSKTPRRSSVRGTSWKEELAQSSKKRGSLEDKDVPWYERKRYEGLATDETLRKILKGEVAEVVERKINALGHSPSPLDVVLVIATTPGVPWDIQHEAIKTVMPYVHAKKAPAFELGSKTPAEIAMDIKTHLDAIDTSTQGES